MGRRDGVRIDAMEEGESVKERKEKSEDTWKKREGCMDRERGMHG